MNVKQYLYSIRDERQEIKELRERIEDLEMSLYPSGIRYDKDNVQSSPSQDRMAETVATIADYETMLQDRLDWLANRQKKAQWMINQLTSSLERQILNLYFLSARKTRMDDIAGIVGYSKRTTYRYYLSGIKHIEAQIPQDVEKLSPNGSECH